MEQKGKYEAMACREVHDLSEAYVSGQVPVERARVIAWHLHRCPMCQTEVEEIGRLRTSIRSAYLTSPELSPAPQFVTALRSRLHSHGVPADRVRSWRRPWLALAAAMVLVVGGGFGVRGVGVLGFTAILHAAVGDHRFCIAALKLTDETAPRERRARQYTDPVDRSLDRIELSSSQLSGGPIRIIERHSCIYDGRRFAHSILSYKGALISVVVTPDQRWLRGLPGASAPAGGSVTGLPPTEGLQVAALRGPRHLVFLVSSLGDDDLREVAEFLRPALSRALQGG